MICGGTLRLGVLAVLSASAAGAQVDTLRVDTTASGHTTVTLRDASRAPGSAAASVTDSGATILLGPRADSTAAPTAPPRSRLPAGGVFWIVAIGGAVLSALFASLAARRRRAAPRRRRRR